MSLFEHLRTAVTGQSPADRAKDQADRRRRIAAQEKTIKELEQQIRDHDRYQDPKNHLAPHHIDTRPSVHAHRNFLVGQLDYARKELRFLKG